MTNYAGECPLCGEDVYKRDNGYKCSSGRCTLEIPLVFEGVEITEKMAQKLLGGKMIKAVEFVSKNTTGIKKTKKKYKSSLALSETGHLHRILGQ